MKKNIGKGICFLLLLILIIYRINHILSFKYTDGITQMEQFYKQKKGTVDVLVLGSSHAFVNVDPFMLYERKGIAAYDLCASMQPTWHTYYYLKEALKYQKPKLIVMDVFRMVENYDYSKKSKLIKSTFGMRFSRNKYDSICAGLQEKEKSEAYIYLFEFPNYHSRYVDIEEEDFSEIKSNNYHYKGNYILETTKAIERPKVDHVIEEYPIESKTLDYFDRILELAKQENIPLLLINAPYCITEDDKKIYNSLEKHLKTFDNSYQISYVDFNQMYDELHLDFEHDFADVDHLNQSGVAKLNIYLADYISTNYNLEDRREDAYFNSYERNVKKN